MYNPYPSLEKTDFSRFRKLVLKNADRETSSLSGEEKAAKTLAILKEQYESRGLFYDEAPNLAIKDRTYSRMGRKALKEGKLLAISELNKQFITGEPLHLVEFKSISELENLTGFQSFIRLSKKVIGL